MDKNTLSNYGWIVIAVLVLSVMIALATPFGEYIKAGVESTTAGLFDTSEKAMNVVGMSASTKEDGVGGVSSKLYAPIESPYAPNNMFDVSTLIAGKAIGLDGTNTLVDVAAHSASAEISVEPETEYKIIVDSSSGISFRTLFILNDGTVSYQSMSISHSGRKIVTPENCVAFRISGTTELMETFKMVPTPTTTVAFIGDSITSLPYGWDKLVSSYYYFNNSNAAIGGCTISSFGRIGTPSKTRDPIVERYTTDLNPNADICMVAAGTNDWWYSWCDIGTDSDAETTTFKGALHTLCKGLKNIYGDKPIIFLTPIKRGEVGQVNTFGRTLEDYANAIIDVCAQYNIDVIDLYHTCPLDPSIPEQQEQFFDGNLNVNEGYTFLYDDSTHPNVYGSRVQARYVIDALNKILK